MDANRAGAGRSYSFPKLDVFASYIAYVGGTDTHVGRALTIWPELAVRTQAGTAHIRKADLIWRNAQTGDVAEWLMNGAFIKSWSTLRGVDTSWQISGIGDRDADGKLDLIWRNSNTGEMSCWLMNGPVIKGWTPMVPDANWLQAVVAGPLELSQFSVILIEGRRIQIHSNRASERDHWNIRDYDYFDRPSS